MRLDHLLSKEHISSRRSTQVDFSSGRDCFVPTCGTADAHGWNTDKHSFHHCRPECRWEKSYIDALLGPERTRECFLYRKVTTNKHCRSNRGGRNSFGLVSARVVGCVLFENCTVDASIFVVSNEERTVDALAPGADEGRRRLR